MKKQQGFTLIEIAIVLVIIGLLIGGVLKGQELIKTAQVRKAIGTIDELKASVFGFRDRYRGLPGDMTTATNLVGANAVNCAGNRCNNGLIQPWAETNIVTNNLSVAGFYSGPFATARSNARPNLTNSPVNPWGAPMHIAYWNNFNSNGARSTSNANGVYTGRAIPSVVLAEIDRKIDDGNPQTGSFRSADQRILTATCVAGIAWVVDNGNADCSGVALY